MAAQEQCKQSGKRDAKVLFCSFGTMIIIEFLGSPARNLTLFIALAWFFSQLVRYYAIQTQK